MNFPHDSTITAQPQQPCRTESNIIVGLDARKFRALHELFGAAVCRGDNETAHRYWRELGQLIGAHSST